MQPHSAPILVSLIASAIESELLLLHDPPPPLVVTLLTQRGLLPARPLFASPITAPRVSDWLPAFLSAQPITQLTSVVQKFDAPSTPYSALADLAPASAPATLIGLPTIEPPAPVS